MAKIQSESIVITFSKLTKDNEESNPITNGELVTSLEAVAQELAGAGIVVEIQVA
jgi:hypothetical protein